MSQNFLTLKSYVIKQDRFAIEALLCKKKTLSPVLSQKKDLLWLIEDDLKDQASRNLLVNILSAIKKNLNDFHIIEEKNFSSDKLAFYRKTSQSILIFGSTNSTASSTSLNLPSLKTMLKSVEEKKKAWSILKKAFF